MANIKSAAKRARQSAKRAFRNSSILASLKTEQKKLRKALTEGSTAAAKDCYNRVISVLDKAAKNGVIHKNVANRRKSKFNRSLKSASV